MKIAGVRPLLLRVAVKVGYDGARFSGSQVQPGVRTVHGELASALRAMGHEAPEIRWAGRTDAGVSAAANVAVFETHLAPTSLLPGLSNRMEDAWAWAWSEVPQGFEPRHARRRRYRYFLRTELAADDLAASLKLFEGRHDFTAFCRLEPDVDPVRTVLATRATRQGPYVVLDVEGESFLWNQVRRMVSAAERVAEGRVPAKLVEEALSRATPAPVDLGTAPPEALVLLDVEYAGIAFHLGEGRIFDRLESRLAQAQLHETMLRALRGGA